MSNEIIIETERLRLVAGTKYIAHATITDKQIFSSLLKAKIPDEWPHALLNDAEPYFAEMLAKEVDSVGWWIWYVILKSPMAAQDILIGNSCFKGCPSSTGVVEIGYAILEEFEGKGFATEAVKILIDWAFKHRDVACIVAETFPNLLPSIRVMEKCGLKFVGNGSEEGTIRYELLKSKLASL